MFIFKKSISRRTVLRGMGATIALPFLESMLPAQTPLRKSAAVSRPRLCAIEMVHGSSGSTREGTEKHMWSPAKEGADFEITPILRSMAPHQDYLTILSHTDLKPAEAFTAPEAGADHTRSSAAFLTAAHSKMTEGSDIYNGVSLDQIYAQKYGQDTPLPSIQLCIEDVGSLTGACGYGYSCVYANTISWASPTTPLPMERDPRVAFERLFGDGATAEERLARRQADRSILDGIIEKVDRLQKGLGASDRARLTDYLDDVREIERRIQNAEKHNAGKDGALPSAPIGVPESWIEHVKMMFDLQVLAFRTDTTKVSAFKMGRDVSSRVYTESDVKTPFHTLSHHGETTEKIAEFARLNEFHVNQVSYFIDKMKNTLDGDGNLLDHSLIIYGSPMGDGNIHNHLRVPLFLAGKMNGQLKGNWHVKYADGTPTANVWLTLLHKLGVDIDTIGDSTGAAEI
jgi:hypothetical protein